MHTNLYQSLLYIFNVSEDADQDFLKKVRNCLILRCMSFLQRKIAINVFTAKIGVTISLNVIRLIFGRYETESEQPHIPHTAALLDNAAHYE